MMGLTRRMAVVVGDLIVGIELMTWQRRLYGRLRRLRKLNRYLAKRLERETPEEQEAFGLIWPPVEIGGEA